MENIIKNEAVTKEVKINPFIEQLIQKYYVQVKNNVISTIELGKILVELDDNYDKKVISTKDIRYFCSKINLLPSSSQYRKLRAIGRHADFFEKYIENMPNAVSVLYKLTSVDQDQAIELINSNVITANTTLSQLSGLVDKTVAPKPVNELVIKIVHNETNEDKKVELEDSIKQNVNAVFADVYSKSSYENCVLKINNVIVIDKKLSANSAPQLAEVA